MHKLHVLFACLCSLHPCFLSDTDRFNSDQELWTRTPSGFTLRACTSACASVLASYLTGPSSSCASAPHRHIKLLPSNMHALVRSSNKQPRMHASRKSVCTPLLFLILIPFSNQLPCSWRVLLPPSTNWCKEENCKQLCSVLYWRHYGDHLTTLSVKTLSSCLKHRNYKKIQEETLAFSQNSYFSKFHCLSLQSDTAACDGVCSDATNTCW